MKKDSPTYTEQMSVNNQNKKASDTTILNLDTIRGCTNNCASCYAKKVSLKKHFNIPVPVKRYTGRPDLTKTYRFGCCGDPSTDWNHTETLIKLYGFINYFMITKLQSLEGYTGLCNKLQVSVDPLNEEHFNITLQNVETLISKYPNIQIVLRIRSCASYSYGINFLMKKAMDFAKKYNLPVLETRTRFVTKSDLIKYCIQDKYYTFRKGYFRPNKGTSFLKTSYVCDLKEKSCKGCKNCLKLFGFLNEERKVA